MLDLAKEQLQLVLHGGAAIVAVAAAAAVICTIIFTITGKKIKRELECDYGSLEY